MHEEQLKEMLDEPCSCSTNFSEGYHPWCDLCFLSEVKESFYCPEHEVESHDGYYEDDESSENEAHTGERRPHDCYCCACALLQDFSENTPVEISTRKVKNVPLYFKSIDPEEFRVSFLDPASKRIVSTDCRNITSIRYNKYE